MPRVPFALRENVSPIGSRMATFDGAVTHSPSQLSPISHKPSKCPSGNANRLESSYFASFKLFNLSAPFLKLLKCATARTSHAKVIVKQTRVLKFDFFLLKRFGEVLTGDPNAPAGVLGPPLPPSTRVQNLRIM